MAWGKLFAAYIGENTLMSSLESFPDELNLGL
jgi:hypothetical protein